MRLIILVALLAPTLATAAPITIDFENATLGATEVVDQGFRISGGAFGDTTRLGVMDESGNQYFEAFGQRFLTCACSPKLAEVVLDRQDGTSFAFYGADLTGYETTSIEGLLSNGNSAIDPVGTGDWLSVTSVVFSAHANFCTGCFFGETSRLEVDNIVVGSVVPIPAAVWLFGSALAGIGVFRAKKSI